MVTKLPRRRPQKSPLRTQGEYARMMARALEADELELASLCELAHDGDEDAAREVALHQFFKGD